LIIGVPSRYEAEAVSVQRLEFYRAPRPYLNGFPHLGRPLGLSPALSLE